MVIPDIQTQNLHGATFQPNVSIVDVIKSPNAVAAVNTESKTGSSSTGSDPSDTFSPTNSTKVTLSSDKVRTARGDAAEKKQAEQQQDDDEAAAGNEYSLIMTGIPLFGGKLVSVIKYPDGQSEMFDSFTGKRISQQDLALLGVLHGVDPEQVMNFESNESDSGLTAAEVYQRIQELLGKENGSDE
ncbi:hypothetical protein [Candidatus Symbiopectobacterium sp.]|uniref:hypothetical protein n=1 Tax=Candidatus Symbiopectobacterium sp. TaxID=2816440 RepID=UPI0025B8BE25|nr:hypothetical protein [Candidatus Symbiopectobacterium sp.]